MNIISKVFHAVRERGVKFVIERATLKARAYLHLRNLFYISNTERNLETNTEFTNNVKFSILVPLYNTPETLLREMIRSVQSQTYSNWELCLADGSDNEHENVRDIVWEFSSSDSRIKYTKIVNKGIAENTNACAELATGEYIGLLDHDDLLHPSALYWYAKEIEETSADFIYSDEVIFTKSPGMIVWTNFKPDYSPEMLRSYNYITHFSVFSKVLFDRVGRFKTGYDGAQDYDLILRLTEQAKRISHVKKAAYFWRSTPASTANDIGAKPYAILAGQRAVADHLVRIGYKGTVSQGIKPTHVRTKYELKGTPLVSIVIANKDHKSDLENLLNSVFEKTTYPNYEIVIVENNSTSDEIFKYYDEISDKHNNINIVRYEDTFNYSAINNLGVQSSKGEYVVLLNNDMTVITEDWIQEMMMHCQREEIGVVGAKLYYPDDTIQHAGIILGIGKVAGHSHKYLNRYEAGYVDRLLVCQNYSAVTGACLMTKRAVWDSVGGLNEKLAVAFNDVDYCLRVKKTGKRIVFTPFAELYHYESKSRGSDTDADKIRRFTAEVELFRDIWAELLKDSDPYYNPNLSTINEKFYIK